MKQLLALALSAVVLTGCGSSTSTPDSNSGIGGDNFADITLTVDGHPLRCVTTTYAIPSISCDWQGWHNQ